MCQMRARANETDIKNSPDENKQKKENDHYAVKIKFMNKNIETPLREQESVCSFNRSFCIFFSPSSVRVCECCEKSTNSTAHRTTDENHAKN